MTLDQYISMGASIGAFLAALATFLTVWQVAKQRRASYKPEIVITSATVITEADKDDQSLAPLLEWKDINDDTAEKANFMGRNFYLRLINIGMGSATNVSAKWTFPMESFVKEIRRLAKEFNNALSIEYANDAVSITKPMLTSFWTNQQNFQVDYLLPAAIEKEPMKIEVPSAYILAVSAYTSLFLPFVGADAEEKNTPNVPALKIELEFYDIAGERHKMSFDIEFEWHMFTPYEFEASLLPKKINKSWL